MSDRVSLVPGRDRPDEGRVLGLVVLLLCTGIAMLVRPLWAPTVPPGVLVEVTGDVPFAGWHVVDPPTLAAAVDAAGASSDGVATRPVHEGDAVVVEAGSARLVPVGNPLLLALPVDVNTHDARALASVPGISAELAAAIVAHRDEHGPFRSLRGLAAVQGLGASTAASLAPMLTTGDVSPRLDPNTATAVQLQTLPGVGPVLAARIVAHREAHGPFPSVDGLTAVRGIGPSLLDDVRDELELVP